jgi:hypothetical protein
VRRGGTRLGVAIGALASMTLLAGVVVAASAPALASKPSADVSPRGRDTGPRSRDASHGICTSAKDPQLAAQISAGVTAALASRVHSAVGLTVFDSAEDLTCALHATWHFDAASVIKVTIISALLLKEGGPSRLSQLQRSEAWGMITESDDDDATDLWNDVGGVPGMQVFLTKARMTHTELSYSWGLTQLTAQDEMTLLQLLTNQNNVLDSASREYVMWLMANVTPSQRWGVPDGAPTDVTVHVKNGWLPYPDTNLAGTDWQINSIGAFTGRNIDYQIVVLTRPSSSAHPDQSESDGIATIQAAARVINKDLARA